MQEFVSTIWEETTFIWTTTVMEQNCEIGLRLDIIVDIIRVFSVWNEKSERIREISLLSEITITVKLVCNRTSIDSRVAVRLRWENRARPWKWNRSVVGVMSRRGKHWLRNIQAFRPCHLWRYYKMLAMIGVQMFMFLVSLQTILPMSCLHV